MSMPKQNNNGRCSYALTEVFQWQEGLNLKFTKAWGFYGIITVATLIGLLLNFIGVDPIKALVYTAVINGVVAVPLIFIIALIARNTAIYWSQESNYRADAKNEMANSAISIVAVPQLPSANRRQRNPDDGARALFVARKLP